MHDIDADVTVEQLLNHTSGVPDYFDEMCIRDRDVLEAAGIAGRNRIREIDEKVYLRELLKLSLIHI